MSLASQELCLLFCTRVDLIHSLEEEEGCDSKQAETNRIKQKQAAWGPNVRTKLEIG